MVAEGVESEAVARRLEELGCDVLQGYYFAKPLPQSEFVEFLSKGVPRVNTAR